MSKKYLKVVSISLLLSGLMFTGCNGSKVKITFVSEENSDIIRYVAKGKSLVDIPNPPKVKGKYCLWDTDTFYNLEKDLTVNALCYSTVTNLYTNISSNINVEVGSESAELDYIFKDLEVEATFESGETKQIYSNEYTIDSNGYNKDVGGVYTVSIKYNNAKKDINIHVNKVENYVTVSLSGNGYYNEGLPNLIANTEVEGNVSFDPGQTLYVGNKSYAWTFTPSNTDKYAIVKGHINVNLLNASEIIANKENLKVDFGTTKQEIIDLIKDELIVKGKYGNLFKDIDEQYYTIDSDDFIVDRSGTFNFKISYSSSIYTIISVEVDKCNTYYFNIDNVEEFIMKNDSTLNDVLSVLNKSSDIDGTLSFDEAQTLSVGNYDYDYTFIPNNSHYATRKGKVKIHCYSAVDMDFTTTSSFEYGSDIDDILLQLKDNTNGKIIYTEGLEKNINSDNISISILGNYNNLESKEYQYIVNYNNEIEVTSSFILRKRVLIEQVDFTYNCQEVDDDNYQSLPICTISKLASTKYDFDANLFTIVPSLDVPVVNRGNGVYEYQVELVPDESISDNYARITITIIALGKIVI